jgi:hypothetical protein
MARFIQHSSIGPEETRCGAVSAGRPEGATEEDMELCPDCLAIETEMLEAKRASRIQEALDPFYAPQPEE